MKGATAEPSVTTMSTQSSSSVTRIGASHHFLRMRMKLQNSPKIERLPARFVICFATALVIITTGILAPGFHEGLGGVEMTSKAFERSIAWSPVPLALAATLFALSTMISWAYYGLKGWTYLVGEGPRAEAIFKAVFCIFVVLGCTLRLDAVLDFSDAMVFVICVPNIIGLYLLAPVVRRELASYRSRLS